MLQIRSYLRANILQSLQYRCKTVNFKPKVARSRPLKTPSNVALDHFDFYYGPMFAKRWPSVRLGLLTPNKYVAVVNTFSESWESHESILTDIGTMDLLAKVCGKSATERIEEKKKKIDVQAKRDTDVALQENKQEQESSLSNTSLDANRVRSAAGIGEFQHSSSTLTVGQLQLSSRKERRNKMDFEITGYEGEGMQLPKRKHFIYYPRSLRIHTFERGVLADFPPPVKDNIGVPSWWLLDGGSIVPVLALGLQEGDSLLDLCSAPGGKSLLALLTGLTQKVVCNEFKLSRLGQLKRALSTYIPPESKLSDSVILKRKDASDIATWDELNVYDKVIADVPCSTDRLAVNQDDGNLFSTQMTNQRLALPELQTKILINALRSVKVGGSVVYSTCTLSSIQNEAVVENAVAIAENKFKIKVVEECLSQLTTHLSSSGLFRFSDQCKRGALVLPFLPSNFGPMYICKLSRLQ